MYTLAKGFAEDPRKTRIWDSIYSIFSRFRAKGSRKARERCAKDVSTRAMSCPKWAAFSHAWYWSKGKEATYHNDILVASIHSRKQQPIYCIVCIWVCLIPYRFLIRILDFGNATLMGPRKEAKDSRKICERGVPGNFYLTQPPYTTLWLHYSLTLLFLYSSNYSFTLLTILVFFCSETWPYYSLTLLLLIILLFQSTILLLYQSFTLLFFDFIVLCCYSSILRLFFFLALLFFDSAISFVYWKFLNKMSFDYYMIWLIYIAYCSLKSEDQNTTHWSCRSAVHC